MLAVFMFLKCCLKFNDLTTLALKKKNEKEVIICNQIVNNFFLDIRDRAWPFCSRNDLIKLQNMNLPLQIGSFLEVNTQ